MAETAQLARDVIAAPDRGLGATLSTYATGLGDRYLGFGIGRTPAESSLVQRVTERWQPMGQGAHDLSVFGDDALGGMAHEWGSYGGYHWGFESGGPLVIPVDPVEHPTGFAAQQTRRPSRQPPFVTQARRDAPARPRPVARETWRATTEAADAPLSPYPAALGRAGAIDPQLLRFPDARAQLRPAQPTGQAGPRGLITAPGPSRRWGGAPAGTLAPAAAGAEALAEALVAAADGPVAQGGAADAWLVDAELPPAARAAWATTPRARAPRLGAQAALPLRAARRADAPPPTVGFGADPVGDLVAASPTPLDPADLEPQPSAGRASSRRAAATASPVRTPDGPRGAAATPARRGAGPARPRRPFVPAAIAQLLSRAQPAADIAAPTLAPWRSPAEPAGTLVAPRAPAMTPGELAAASAPARRAAATPRRPVTSPTAPIARPEAQTPRSPAPGVEARPVATPTALTQTAGGPAATAGPATQGVDPAPAAPGLPADPLSRALARAAHTGAAPALGDRLPWPSAPRLPAGPRAAAQAVQALVARLTAGGGPAVAPALAARWVRWLSQPVETAAPAFGRDEAPGALVAPAAAAAAEVPGEARGAPAKRSRLAAPTPAGVAEPSRSATDEALPPAARAAIAHGASAATPGAQSLRTLNDPATPAPIGAPASLLQSLLGSSDGADPGLGGLLDGLLGRADALIGRLGQSAWGPAAADPQVAAALSVGDGAPGALVAPIAAQAPGVGSGEDPPSRPARPRAAAPTAAQPLVDAVADRTVSPASPGAALPAALAQAPSGVVRPGAVGLTRTPMGVAAAAGDPRRPGPAIGRVGRQARAFGSQRLGARRPARRRAAAFREGLGATLVRPLGPEAQPLPSGRGGTSARARRGAERAPVLGQLPAGLARTLATIEGRTQPLIGRAQAAASTPALGRPWARAAGLAGGWDAAEAPGALVAPSDPRRAGSSAEGERPASISAPRAGASPPRPAQGLPGAAGVAATAFAAARADLEARLFGPPPRLEHAPGTPGAPRLGLASEGSPGALVAPGSAGSAGSSEGVAARGSAPPSGRRPARSRADFALPAVARRAMADAAVLAAVGRRAARPRRAMAGGAAGTVPGAVVHPGTPGRSAASPSGLQGAAPSGRRRPMRPANVDRALVAFGRAAQAQAAQQGGTPRAPSGAPPAGMVAGAVGELFSPSSEVGTAIGRPGAARVRPSLHLPGSLFADRGPSVSLGTPGAQPRRVMVDTSRSTAAEALRSTPGQRPQRKAETAEEARHRNADQSEDALSPEEVERIARDVITMLEREAEFDLDRFGEDYD